ncbi:MAG: BrnT family toxin [Gemmatimonadales bacterium]
MPVEFEWDEWKREINLTKHGVDFVRAARCLIGPVIYRRDTRDGYGEARFVAIGRLEGLMVAVVFTPRGDTLRLISARKANRREQAAYRALRPEEA